MLWQEDNPSSSPSIPDDIVDLAFRITCRSLPVEHAAPLSRALHTALPWLEDEEHAGIHLIHVAESGNGWIRPDGADNALLHLSRRTRLTLRLPKYRLDEAHKLTGTTLDIDGFPLAVEKGTVRPLSTSATVFSRYVVTAPDDDETRFVDYLVEKLKQMDIRVRKLLCGRPHVIPTPDEHIYTRSVMIADLGAEDSLRLQQQGLGPRRKIGCGLFIPHKSIDPVRKQEAE